MAEVTLKPIVIPRAWDRRRIQFAVVFSFEPSSNATAPPSAPSDVDFDHWPEKLGGLGWHQPSQPESLTLEQAARQIHLEVTFVGGETRLLAVSWPGLKDRGEAQTAWEAIIKPAKQRSAAAVATRGAAGTGGTGGGLASIFRNTAAPPPNQRLAAGAPAHGSDVAVNPRGGSDLRPTQRIESLELDSATSFAKAADIHAKLATASRHELSLAKTAAFKNRSALDSVLKRATPSHPAGTSRFNAMVGAISADATFAGLNHDLVTAVHLANKAAEDGKRLQRSIELGKNRPLKRVAMDQITGLGLTEVLARLKQHPGAMRKLGLVIECSAPLGLPEGTSAATGLVALKLGLTGNSIEVADVGTNFQIGTDGPLPYFRALEQNESLDNGEKLWRQYHLLPNDYFSLRQDDPARAVAQARLGTQPTAAGQDSGLTDAIIIQTQHPTGTTVADAIHGRLRQAQIKLNGDSSPAPGAPAQKYALELHAEDLMSGVTFEVAVGTATEITGSWHSLCRRTLTVTDPKARDPKKKILFEDVEDGYVSTSVATSAPPLVGTIKVVTKSVEDDKTSLDKYTLTMDQDGAYNTPGATAAPPLLVTARRQEKLTPEERAALANEPAAQPTQLASLIRDYTDIGELARNTDGTGDHDRVLVTLGPLPAESGGPTLVESLFLSPVFKTAAFSDAQLPHTGLQVIRAASPLRAPEEFYVAFEGGTTAFLKVDGTPVPEDTTTWLPSFQSFEAEGERRSYLRAASDAAAERQLGILSDAGPVTSVLSDSVPQAALSIDHAMQLGTVSLVPLPFAPHANSDRVTKKPDKTVAYPMSFRFRGTVDPATTIDLVANKARLVLTGVTPADGPLECPLSVVSDRAGHPVNPNDLKGKLVSGDGVLTGPTGALTVVQLHVLGTATDSQDAFPEGNAAKRVPFVAWVPRAVRVETELQTVRGPVTGLIGFDCAGIIERATPPDKTDARQFALPRGKDEPYASGDVQDCRLIGWKDTLQIVDDKDLAKGPARKKIVAVREFILPSGLATAQPPAAGQIIRAKGRMAHVVVAEPNKLVGQKNLAAEDVFLVESWNVLSRAGVNGAAPEDKDLSDEARAVKATPHFDWIVTISTDDRGDVAVNFDATRIPSDATTLFHPLALHLPADDPKAQPFWVEAVCTKSVASVRGAGWPGWVAAYAAAIDPKKTPTRTLTLLDLRPLAIKAVGNDDGKADRVGYFRLKGRRGDVSVAVDADANAANPFKGGLAGKPLLLRVLGEIVSSEIDSANCILHIAGLTGSAPWQLRLRCHPDARFGDITPDLLSRRAVDLLPGDCVFATVRPSPSGWFEIVAAADDPDALPASAGPNVKIVALAAGLSGKWTPAARSGANLTRAVLTGGSMDFLRGAVTTRRGVSRQLFAPKDITNAAPFDASHPASLERAMLRHLPLAYANTIIAHASPTQLAAPQKPARLQSAPGTAPAPGAAATPTSFPAVHAVASDALARWRGWWLTVPQPGESDLTTPDPRADLPYFKCAPSGSMLPLRTGKTYWIRGWRTDLAGNIGFELLSTAAQKALSELEQKSPESVARRLDNFQRPDLPLAPILAQPGKDLGLPAFSYAGYGLQPDPQPGSSSQTHVLVLVTNRKGSAVPARKFQDKVIYYPSAYLLPPPVDVETALSSGKLDKKGADAVSATIYQHEQFYDDNLFGRRLSTGLNYFPDPFVTEAALGITEILSAMLHQPDRTNDPQASFSHFGRVTFFPDGKWPEGGATPKLDLASGLLNIGQKEGGAAFVVPRARVARAQIVGTATGTQSSGVIHHPGLTIDLIHAVTGPLRQPQWTSLVGDPPRLAGDTAQSWKGVLTVERPSTGAVRFSLRWTDLWDETVPALFSAAKVHARASNGVIDKITIDDAGFGYGSEAVVEAIDSAGGQDTELVPMLKDGRLVDVTIRQGGSGYPRDGISVRIVRRPPLYKLAAAVAKVSNSEIEEVVLAEGAEGNGYYATPPLVRIHDLKGTGSDATCEAVVRNGQVTGFKVGKKGKDYSESVVVGIYTNEANIPERAVPDRNSVKEAAWSTFPFEMSYAFGDTRARHLHIFGEGHTRFRDEVPFEEPIGTEPRRYELPSTARPPKPEIAYLLPSLAPQRLDDTGPGLLIEQHDKLVRCYVQRPWNVTGDELLGVVVFGAQINTTVIKADPAYEGLIPMSLRKYVSRWGFDPVWDDVATSPLTIDDFTNAVDVARHDDLAELGGDAPPVSVALHQMRYSATRDMWYADIAIRPPAVGMPFVQLALVRYQKNSVQGLSMSEVALADPFPLSGQRRLKLRHAARDEVSVEVTGNFDGPRTHEKEKPAALPVRKIVIELRRREAGFPREIEGELAYHDGHDGDALDRWQLARAKDGRSFSGRIALGATLKRNPAELYLAVKEFEVYPAAASYRDGLGNAGVITGQRPTYEKLVFYRALRVTDLVGA